MLDDVVLREVTILRRDCLQLAKTLRELRAALRSDPRFATVLAPTGENERVEQLRLVEKGGPEDLNDPFSRPLTEDHD